MIKPVVEKMEAARMDGRDSELAWQIKSGGITEDARRKARQRAREFKAAARQNAEKLRESLEGRPFLFDRATIEADKEKARQRALITVTKKTNRAMRSGASDAHSTRFSVGGEDDIDAALEDSESKAQDAERSAKLANAGIDEDDTKYLM